MDVFSELWAMAKQGGPFASVMLLLVLYFVNEERREVIKENKALHDKHDALVEKLFTVLGETKSAIQGLSDLLAGAGTSRRNYRS